MPFEPAQQDLSWTHEAHRRRQVRRGLELTPAERLRWLETTLEEMRSLLGRARVTAAPRSTDAGSGAPRRRL